MLKITLIKSMIGRPEKHRRVLRGMGLTKINKIIEMQDNSATRGMIHKVKHLVSVKEGK